MTPAEQSAMAAAVPALLAAEQVAMARADEAWAAYCAARETARAASRNLAAGLAAAVLVVADGGVQS